MEAITRVFLTDADAATIIDNSSAASSTVPYEDFTAVEGTVIQGQAYPIALEGYTGGNYTNYFTVWVDWNQDGAFESSEMMPIGSIVNSTGTDGKQAVGTINVPADAVLGSTTMRVIKNFGASPTNPCGTYSFGQAEDYTLIIEEMSGCTGVPDGGTSFAPAILLEGSSYTITASGFTVADGMEYQWQSNTDGAGWVDEGVAMSMYSDYTGIATETVGTEVEWRLSVSCILSTETVYSTVSSYTVVCGVEQPGSLSNGLGNLVALFIADDFEVEANTILHANVLSLKTLGDITEATTLAIYSDNGGVPGAEIESFSNLVPSSKTFVGVNFAFDTYAVVFDLPTTVDLDGGETGARYWVGLQVGGAGPVYWETADVVSGSVAHYTSDGGATWTPNSSGLDLSFILVLF